MHPTFFLGSIFKHLPERYAKEMMDGRILLRTPKWCRDQEASDPARGDKHECKWPVVLRVDKGWDVPNMPIAEQQFYRNVIGDTDGYVANVIIENNVQVDGVLLYCTSYDGSGRLLSEFNSDTVVEITDPRAFVRAVRKAALQEYQRKLRFEFAPCEYVKLPLSPSDAVTLRDASARVKSFRFQHQEEARLAIRGLDPAVDSKDEHFLNVPELRDRSLCRIPVPSLTATASSVVRRAAQTFTLPTPPVVPI